MIITIIIIIISLKKKKKKSFVNKAPDLETPAWELPCGANANLLLDFTELSPLMSLFSTHSILEHFRVLPR